MKNVRLTFPVSPEVCLLGTWEGDTGKVEVADAIVERWNQSKVAWAERFVFSHSQDLADAALKW